MWMEKKKKDKFQQKCCKWTKSCKNDKIDEEKDCKDSKKICKFRGPKISMSLHKRCNWKIIYPNARRRECCHLKKLCNKKNCKDHKVSCQLIGPVVSEKVDVKCKWKKLSPASYRKECCYFRNTCVDKNCKKTKKCRFFGDVIGVGKKCFLVTVGDVKKKQCCTWKSKCIKTLNGTKCSDLVKKCKTESYNAEEIISGHCVWKAFNKQGTSKRQFCCKNVKVCGEFSDGNSCNIKKQCNWFGKEISVEKNIL